MTKSKPDHSQSTTSSKTPSPQMPGSEVVPSLPDGTPSTLPALPKIEDPSSSPSVSNSIPTPPPLPPPIQPSKISKNSFRGNIKVSSSIDDDRFGFITNKFEKEIGLPAKTSKSGNQAKEMTSTGAESEEDTWGKPNSRTKESLR